MSRFLITLGIALLLLCIESVSVQALGFSVTRFDCTVALVVFLGLRATVLEGAVTAFGVGYLLDVFTGRPTGLYPFLAVLIFLLVRLLASFVTYARSRGITIALTAAATFVHALLAVLFSTLTSPDASGTATLSGVPLQVLLSTAVAFLLWPLLQKLDPGQTRPQTGLLL